MQKYVPQFVQQTCFFVNEIKYHVEDNKFSDKFKFFSDMDKTRIHQMISGAQDALVDFQFLTR